MTYYDNIKQKINDHNATLCIVTKNRTIEQIQHYYDLGERIFGENRAQELLTKVHMADDIEWHFIGHLQTNKVKDIMPHVTLIHSVDRLDLLPYIEKEAAKHDKIQEILIQFNIAREDTKSGIHEDEAEAFLHEVRKYPHIRPRGIMCMGPHVEDEAAIEEVFEKAHILSEQLKEKDPDMNILSLGMSQDAELALKHGSTMVRIGTALFI